MTRDNRMTKEIYSPIKLTDGSLETRFTKRKPLRFHVPRSTLPQLAQSLEKAIEEMGMFDTFTPFAESGYNEGDVFRLVDAKVSQITTAEYGTRPVAQLKITGPNGGDKWFTIFGAAIADQVSRMEAGDLPAEVKIVRVPSKKGNQGMKQIVPADWQGTTVSAPPAGDNDDIAF